jgi:hypothetical protein
MKLTKKEEWFIEDVRTLIERGETFINLNQWEINPKVANDLLSCYLGIDIWICGKWKGMFDFDYYISTNFNTRYIVSDTEMVEYSPIPFTIYQKTDSIFSDKEAAIKLLQHRQNFNYHPNKKQVIEPWYKRLFK